MMSGIKHKTIPIFVSHMGCPNDCAFCNQRTITGQSRTVTPDMADEMISQALGTLPENAKTEIGFFGGSFTGIDMELQKALLSVTQKYILDGKVHAVRLSTRPDYISEEIVNMLKSYGVTTVELGAQSMDNFVLSENHRGHTAEDTVTASELIHKAGINLGLQMMTGLKGDTDKKSLETTKKLIALKPQCVRIYPTLVLHGTYLEKWYREDRYCPQTVENAVQLCADIKEMFDEADIPVIRMGLMASDQINLDADVVAGPYHPAFGELVQSEMYFRKIQNFLAEKMTDIIVCVHPKSISAYIGNGKRNIRKFAEKGLHVRFVPDETVCPGSFKIL